MALFSLFTAILASGATLAAPVPILRNARIESREVFHNTKFASSLQSAAVSLSGNYLIKNMESGESISFNRDGDVPNLALSSSGDAMALSIIKNDWLRIEADNSGKCFSAQWDFDNGIDHAATLYACCPSDQDCDNGGDQGALRIEKQAYLIVPADSPAIKRAANASERRKRAEDSDEESEDSSSSDSSDVYYIVAVDHIDDMKTRVVTGSTKKTAGGYQSLRLADIDESDKSQQWKFTKA